MDSLPEAISDLRKKTQQNVVLCAMYFQSKQGDEDVFTTDRLKELLRGARVPRAAKIQYASVLSNAGPRVDSPGLSGGVRLWKLTKTGTDYIREQLGLADTDPEVENDIKTLLELVGTLANPVVKAYLEEAVKCYQVGALRATVVFLWVGAINAIQEKIVAIGLKAATEAIQKHDPKARVVRGIESFELVKESVQILAAQDMNIISKGEKQMLVQALDLRNKCGHPGKYQPGPKKVSAMLEDLNSIVYSKL